MVESRGFITIATGKQKYHKMAKTLVKSYKLTSLNPLPFCVITDDEIDKFEEFDDVIRIKDATCSYMDKIDIIRYSPYDETIFIDSDCIAFNDLNVYWSDFVHVSDFAAYGTNYYEDNISAWFQVSEVKKNIKDIKYSIDLHGGIYFFKKTANTEQIYNTALNISENYSYYNFRGFSKPADEPIIALAMAANNAKTIQPLANRFCFLRNTKNLKADFFSRKLSYYFNETRVDGDGLLVHFATLRTILPLYQIEMRKVDFEWKNGHRWTFFSGILNIIIAYFKSFILCIMSFNKILNKRKNI